VCHRPATDNRQSVSQNPKAPDVNRPDDGHRDHEVGNAALATRDSTRVDDVRIGAVRPLISPALLQDEMPMPEPSQALVEAARRELAEVLSGRDDRLIVVGRSIHDHAQALDYARRLKALADD
jgi:3-deoxy-7-phosphoheptulonate synthase